jgi:hypothetical protein
MAAEVNVRRRVDADIPHCATIAELVHQRDGYPIYLPTDLEQFIVSRDSLATWVAVDGTSIVGHVALHPTPIPQVMTCARDCRRPVPRLAWSPVCSSRRRAAGAAWRNGCSPWRRPRLALADSRPFDVVTTLVNAIALYECAGRVRAGGVRLRLPDGNEIDEFVYVAKSSRTTTRWGAEPAVPLPLAQGESDARSAD